jgi:hypothetical protein
MKKSIFFFPVLLIWLCCNEPVELKTYTIKGYIGLEQQIQNIEPFSISLYENDILVATSTSPEFEFHALKAGNSYTLIPESNLNDHIGISTLDLVMIDNYIAGTTIFNPFQVVAADMNQDGIVDVTDKSLLFSCMTASEGCNGHRFVTPDYNGAGQGFIDQITIDHINDDHQVQFYGIKVGDISSVIH